MLDAEAGWGELVHPRHIVGHPLIGRFHPAIQVAQNLKVEPCSAITGSRFENVGKLFQRMGLVDFWKNCDYHYLTVNIDKNDIGPAYVYVQ